MSITKHLAIAVIAFLACALTPARASDIIPWEFSKSDIQHAKNANYWARRDRWDEVMLHTQKADDPIIKDVFLWREYIAGSDNANFDTLTHFIRTHPDWPKLDTLQERVEESILPETPPEHIVAWFTRETTSNGLLHLKEPVTPSGKRALAEALIVLGDSVRVNRTIISKLVRESWVDSDFEPQEEWKFLVTHRTRLGVRDYIDRIDRLLWEDDIRAAKRLMSTVDDGHKALFNARIALKTQNFGVDTAVSAVPNHLQRDEGLLFDRLAWRDRNNRSDGVLELLKNGPSHPQHPDEWWELRRKHIYAFLREKDYDNAYILARNHGFSEDNLAKLAEAEWLAGWLMLRFKQDPQGAYQHFYRMYHKVETPISSGRAAYWAGRAAEANNNEAIAQKWYTVGSKYPSSFYGQLATEKIGKNTLLITPPLQPSWGDIRNYQRHELMKAAYLLHTLGQTYYARYFIKTAVEHAKTPGEQKLIVHFGLELGKKDYSIVAAKEAVKEHGVMILEGRYPTITLIDSRGREITQPEGALIHAIIMQESLFTPYAKSSAGALGLMQLMPATAKEVAGWEKIPFSRQKLTNDPAYNVRLGSAYLQRLINQFNGSYILGIASYNGGAGNVRKWIRSLGDPRQMKQTDDVIDWIESIPFTETRNYVQRVIENTQLYRHLLDSSTPAFVRTGNDIIR